MQPSHTIQENVRQPFWERRDVEAARFALDVWASVTVARKNGCDFPTFDAIRETPRQELPPFRDEVLGLTIAAWHSKHAATSGEVDIRTTSSRILCVQHAVYLSVEKLLSSLEIDPRNFLLRRYPRSGPYEVVAPITNRNNDRLEQTLVSAVMYAKIASDGWRK